MGLERSSGDDPANWIRVAPPAPRPTHGPSPTRIEARFSGHAYDAHRHDSYALGITRAGVQSFRYRGVERHSQAGSVIVLHPDEVHDGHAGDDRAFRYHMLYLDPGVLMEAAGAPAAPPPFVPGGLTRDGRLADALSRVFADMDRALDPLEACDCLSDIAAALDALTDRRDRAIRHVDHHAVTRAELAMLAHITEDVPLDALEGLTGQSRFALTRHFRARHGVPPHRWLMARRLDRVWERVLEGASLADAAADAGFADQSHMTRQFRRRFGLSPGAWREAVRAGGDARRAPPTPSNRPRTP